MRASIVVGLASFMTAATVAAPASAGCCWDSVWGSYAYGGYAVDTRPAYIPYAPTYIVNQGPVYSGPNIYQFPNPVYSGAPYAFPSPFYSYANSYPASFSREYVTRYRFSPYPYVRSHWADWRWQRYGLAGYAAGRTYGAWRYRRYR